jgi:hypothetical protein
VKEDKEINISEEETDVNNKIDVKATNINNKEIDVNNKVSNIDNKATNIVIVLLTVGFSAKQLRKS